MYSYLYPTARAHGTVHYLTRVLPELKVEVYAIHMWLRTATPRHGSEEISSAGLTNDTLQVKLALFQIVLL